MSGASDYVLVSDIDPAGAFATEEGYESSGTTGIVIPLPAQDLVYYLVAGRNPECGLGPLR